jgi:hypothetical protein
MVQEEPADSTEEAGRYQVGLPGGHGRNFVPKHDLTRYCERARQLLVGQGQEFARGHAGRFRTIRGARDCFRLTLRLKVRLGP